MAEILEVMKQMAQSRFTQSKRTLRSTFQDLILSFGPIFETLLGIKETHQLIHPISPVVGVVVTTSDQSFMGALNSKLVKAAKALVTGMPHIFFVTGRKGVSKMKFAREQFVGFPAIKEGAIKGVAREVTQHVIQQVKERKIGRVVVVSSFSDTLSNQVIKPTLLLPFEDLVEEDVKARITAPGNQLNIFQETNTNTLCEYIASLWLYNSLFFLFQSNKPAEYGALAVQMEQNHESVKKVISKLIIAYRRARNEKIDAGMREIFVSTMVSGG